MAICLRRVFANSGQVLLLTRKSRQPNSLNHKFIFSSSIGGEITRIEFAPTGATCASERTGIPGAAARFQRKNDPLEFCNTLNYNYNSSGNLRLDFSGLGSTLYCAKESKAYKDEDQQKDVNNIGKAQPEQISQILNVLSEDLPKIFVKPMNYTIYHPKLVLENNIRGIKTIGLHYYAQQILLLKTLAHIKFAKVTFDILKITAHPEDGTVRVRWRIRGISNYKAFFGFLKYVSSVNTTELEGWYDGFSVYHIYSDGLVHKIIIDKMIPDDQEKVSKYKNNLAAKIGLALGVMMEDFSLQSTSFDEMSLSKLDQINTLYSSHSIRSDQTTRGLNSDVENHILNAFNTSDKQN